MDGFCWSKDDCSTKESICVNNTCSCENGMVFYNNKCVKVFINMPCLKHSECSSYLPFSKCSPSYECSCDTYYSDHIGRCVPDPVSFCTPYYPCKLENSTCNKLVCECKPGFVYRQNACIPISLKDSCIDDYNCHPIPNAICSIDKKCECAENHELKNKSSCIPMLGGNCKEDSDCIIVNSMCSNSLCQCKPNFANLRENECMLVGLGMNCIYDEDCRGLINSKCSDKNTCECIANSVKLNSTMCFPLYSTHRQPNCLNNNSCRSNDGSEDYKNKYKPKHYAMISNTTCAPVLSQYCRPLEQCATINSECIDGKCQCEAGYVNYFNKICVSNAELIAGNFGISCKNDYYCIDFKYGECSHEKKCTCRSNYVALGDDQCIALIGEYCESDSECISYNTVCVDHKCKCPEKFIMQSKYQCDRISLGKTCKQDHDCQIAINNSLCSEDKVCVCTKNHYTLSSFECVPYLNEKCTTDDDCQPNFSACIDNYCQCTLLYRSVSFNRCELFGSLFNCKENLDCGDTWHNICSKDKKCICNNNNTYIDKSTCSPLLGGYCWVDHQCVVPNSICFDFHCKCRDDFRPVSSNMCMPVKT
ncbi:hypothetical protein KQX54_019043 [Cotesia glomerata]|uniref:EGF-like domain-containing protein n=1 Tax=Cotesia glomerata TaxID=32391 RepID=A0AAV7HVL2_COTGL|nr:hypothetical protein KQX54_019043 [Cotesia glomerata]